MTAAMNDSAKLAYSVEEAVEALPWGKTKLYELMASGELPWRSRFGRRYIMREDLLRVLLSQPAGQEERDQGHAA
jgi:hypothetical protein